MSRSNPPAAAVMSTSTPFLDAGAVEAWDAWVRWRCNGELRDLTIDASWDRVAAALASVERADRERWQQRFRDALGEWQLLPDPRILSSAGTGSHGWGNADLCAALNAAAFVRDPFTAWAQFDRSAFEQCATLAVRLLDDAIELAGGADGEPSLQIGLIGIADALALLGVPYASAGAIEQVRDIARLLAQGTLAGTIELAAERGARVAAGPTRLAHLRVRGMPDCLVEAARRHGLRHAALTAIEPMPRLALLANNVADALDPLPAGHGWQTIEAPGQPRRLRSYGYAHALGQRHLLGGAEHWSGFTADIATLGVPAQIELRAALVGWIDAPISYPYSVGEEPDDNALQQWRELAGRLALPPPCWRRVGTEAAV